MPDLDRASRVFDFVFTCVSFVTANDTGFPITNVGNDRRRLISYRYKKLTGRPYDRQDYRNAFFL